MQWTACQGEEDKGHTEHYQREQDNARVLGRYPQDRHVKRVITSLGGVALNQIRLLTGNRVFQHNVAHHLTFFDPNLSAMCSTTAVGLTLADPALVMAEQSMASHSSISSSDIVQALGAAF